MRLSEHYLCGGVRRPLSAFLRGFHELVPAHVLQSCGVDDKDLGLLLTGLPDLDLAAWQQHAEVAPEGCADAAAVAARFFAAVADLAPHDQVALQHTHTHPPFSPW